MPITPAGGLFNGYGKAPFEGPATGKKPPALPENLNLSICEGPPRRAFRARTTEIKMADPAVALH